MPKFLEAKLKKEYPNNPHAVYGTMNAIGAMRGNKETKKGAAMQAKHMREEKHAPHNPGRIEHVHMHLQTPKVAPDRGMDVRGEPHMGPVAGTMPGHVHHGLMKFYHGKATSK